MNDNKWIVLKKYRDRYSGNPRDIYISESEHNSELEAVEAAKEAIKFDKDNTYYVARKNYKITVDTPVCVTIL